MDEIDVWRTARLLVKEHGEDASLEAAQHADALLAQGNMKGVGVWLRVKAAIAELQRDKPNDGEAVN